jgi:LssY C-terminus
MVKDTDASISYPAGTEMTIKLTSAIDVKPGTPRRLTLFANETALANLVNRQPFQTYATNPPVKSDISNLMFVGSRETLMAVFTEAGWANAEALNDRSKFKTAQAIIEQRGYKEAPVSVLILDDRPPDLVYQKGNNTFAARHHLRIWRSPDTFQGQPVWISSSTHDVGIDFSEQSMTFIHRIDPNIDAERAKVVNDLLFTGHVKSIALVPRPKVPQHGKNATGDNLDTDGAMAVLVLQQIP